VFQNGHCGVVEEAIPVLRIDEAAASISWYRRLGYVQEWEYRFEPGFPALVSVARAGGARLFLSEHTGDATSDALVCLRVDSLDAVAQEFGSEILEQPWGREVHLVDPDGNRLRIGDPAPKE
jgi:catechol 2,3-dioxygenase-like lactoylglutathione lyase family enzyme